MFTVTCGVSVFMLTPVDDFGRRLRLFRVQQNARQVQLSGVADRDSEARRAFGQYMSKLETGAASNPSLGVLTRIARGFGLTLSQFFAGLESVDLLRQTDTAHRNPVGEITNERISAETSRMTSSDNLIGDKDPRESHHSREARHGVIAVRRSTRVASLTNEEVDALLDALHAEESRRRRVRSAQRPAPKTRSTQAPLSAKSKKGAGGR